jgi:prevent-host-death family protein
MAEQLKSITDARKTLSEISEAAQERMDRYIITNQGQPQSVLLGYKEYRGMMAAVELMNRPAEMARLKRGLQQLSEGKRLTFDQLKQNIQRRRAQVAAKPTPPRVVGRVLGGRFVGSNTVVKNEVGASPRRRLSDSSRAAATAVKANG